MNSDTHRLVKIDRLFQEALELEPVKRGSFLAGVRAQDRCIADEVEELLGLAEEDGDERFSPQNVLTGPLWESLDWQVRPGIRPAARPGERIGAYEVVRELGRGGMAVVHLARRADGAFDQQVALKLLRPGTMADESLQRFEQERQILASLSHPAIGRLLDGGVDDLGRSYIALEHVEGRPIDRYCDEHRLDLEGRLDLFLEVVRAVQYAHRKLVVHRDLKPSNILVSDDGAVKLLDFGIAKLLDPAAAGSYAAPETRTMHRLLTPGYASPEQVRGEPISTASDVYQLGLLLYELLTGSRAYEVSGTSAVETERIICQQEPRRPSTVEFAAAASAARRTTPAQLAKRLRGDLDNVVLMALRKEPERRYASPTELIEDLRRYRQGLPITARRDTVSYRAQKFVSRHRFGLAAAAVIVTLLVGYAVTITFQAAEIARQRDRAQGEADKARAVKDFLVSLFEVSDPQQARGREISTRELLDQGSDRIRDELAEQPEVQSELLGAVGEIYRRLGLYDRSEPMLRQALELSRGLPTSPQVDDLRQQQGLYLARLLRDIGDYEEADALLRQVLAARRARLPADRPLVAEALAELGLVVRARQRLDEAEALFGEALALYRQSFGDEHEEVASMLSNLGVVEREKGNLDEAENLFRQSFAQRRRLLPEDHPDRNTSLGNLALVLRMKGKDASAEQLLRELVEVNRRVLGPAHPWLAINLSNQAISLMNLGRYDEAEAVLEEAFEIRRASLPGNHPQLGGNLNDLGRVYQHLGRLEEAVEAYQRSLDTYPSDHPWRLVTQFNLASVHEEQGDLATAEAIYREVLAKQEEALGPDHVSVALDRLYLGRLLHKKGASEEAEGHLRFALERFQAELPADHYRVIDSLLSLGVLLIETDRAGEGCLLIQQGAEILAGKPEADSPRLEKAQAEVSRCRWWDSK